MIISTFIFLNHCDILTVKKIKQFYMQWYNKF